MSKYIIFENVFKYYEVGDNKIKALDDMSFYVNKGEFCVILGPSGAGKTTLLNILGGMDNLSEGKVYIDGCDISDYNEVELTRYRRYDIGFVFQAYNLVQNLTALENVELATEIAKNPLNCTETLVSVGLESRINNFPSQLSGGEQQRVSIARALAKNPKVLLCDEPTGALDYVTGKNILSLLFKSCKKDDKTCIVITHNQAIAPMADRVIEVKNGRAIKIYKNENPVPIEDISW